MKKIFSLYACLALVATLSAQNYPFQDQSLSPKERAADLVSRLTLSEKASQMVNEAPAIERLGVPSYMWWNECLHGVARSGKASIFPQSIGLAASFDEDMVERMTDAIGDEARALYLMAERYGNNGKYTGLGTTHQCYYPSRSSLGAWSGDLGRRPMPDVALVRHSSRGCRR